MRELAITFVFYWLLFCTLAAWWAKKRGQSPWLTFVIAVILSPVVAALIVAIQGQNQEVLEKEALLRGGMRRCRYCHELVRRAATVCKHCHSDISNKAATGVSSGSFGQP